MNDIVPEVRLALPDAEWPPANGDTPAGVSRVGQWQTERELVGSVLPGNVRGASGLSIGTASASIPQAKGRPLAPWAQGDRKVSTGRKVELYALTPGPLGDVKRSLGDWIINPISGALASPEVGMELVEAQYVGRQVEQGIPSASPEIADGDFEDRDVAAFSPSWLIDTLARQCGFYSTPPPVVSTVFSMPMQGHTWLETPLNYNGDPFSRPLATKQNSRGFIGSRRTGPITCENLPGAPVPRQVVVSGAIEHNMHIGAGSRFLTFNLASTPTAGAFFTWVGDDPFEPAKSDPYPPEVRVRGNAVQVRNGTGAWSTATTFTPGLHPDWPMRVQVEVQRVGANGSWTGCRARARSGPNVGWSAWTTATRSGWTFAQLDAPSMTVSIEPGAGMSGLQLTTAADPALWMASTAVVDYVDHDKWSTWMPAGMSPWTAIQEIAAAWLCAAWVDRLGVLQCRNRDYLAGVEPVREVIDVGRSVEDLGWTLDPGDQADRLEVTYTPGRLRWAAAGQYMPEVWRADSIIDVPAGGATEVIADTATYPAEMTGPLIWIPAWMADWKDFGSTWSAFPNPTGSGTHALDDALSFEVRWRSAGRAVITIRNSTNQHLYLVDANGEPCMIMRSAHVIDQEEAATLTRGVAASESLNAATIDLGKHVETRQAAEAITDYIWARVNTPMWKASEVNVTPDLDRDIGDVVELRHGRSGLSVKALLTKVANSGEPGALRQSLDVVLLPTIWGDFDTAWAGRTWADFDAAWAGESWSAFTDDPLRTEP